MGWSLGYDSNWERDIGYGVPAICDHPGCNKEIDLDWLTFAVASHTEGIEDVVCISVKSI